MLAKLGALLPYRRACALLQDVFPVGDPPAGDTILQRTLPVGARPEREAIAPPTCAPMVEAETIALSIASGQVRAVAATKCGACCRVSARHQAPRSQP